MSVHIGCCYDWNGWGLFGRDRAGIQMGRQKLVVVLGMHRSGTSAISRSLKVFGVELGNNLIGQHPDNVKGFWEDSDFKVLNEEMLHALGKRWDALSLVSGGDDISVLNGFYARALALLRAKTASGKTFGLKDPRLCVLLPFWQDVFSQSNVDVVYILAVRHPLSVAHSLKKRNGFAFAKSLYLWSQYTLSAVTALFDQRVVVVNYDFLVDRTEYELVRIGAQLGLGPMDTDELVSYCQEFLDSGLRHTYYHPDDWGLEQSLPANAIGAYQQLLALSEDKSSMGSVGVQTYFSEWGHWLAQQALMLSYTASIEQDVTKLHQQLASSQHHIERQKITIEGLEQAITVRDSKVSELKAAIGGRKSIIDGLEQAITVRDAKIAELKSVAQLRADELVGANQQAGQRESDLLSDRDRLQVLLRLRDQHIQEMALSAQKDRKQIKTLNQQLEGERELLGQLRAEASLVQQAAQIGQVSPLVQENQPVTSYLKVRQHIKGLLHANRRGGGQEKEVGNGAVVSDRLSSLAAAVDRIKVSGVFDAAGYLESYPDVKQAGVDPLEHYCTHGASEGRNPHPLFDSAWYLRQYSDVTGAIVNPLLHYLEVGFKEGRDPHPWFSSDGYWRRYPDVAVAGLNPLAHYLQVGCQQGYRPHALFDPVHYLQSKPGVTDGAGAAFAGCIKQLMGQRPRCFPPPSADASVLASFDFERQHAFIGRIKRASLLSQGCSTAPLVSVIMATRNRRTQIRGAIDSILAQTWQKWELHVVDDGSTDGTAAMLREQYPDSRIHIHVTQPGGVSQARNVGLQQAKGEWIAYLDSDNQWVNHFLEVMLAFVLEEGADFAYSAIRLLQDKGILYRFHEFKPDDLWVKNFIDLNSIFHHRRFYEALGGFDTGLARTVDWDLIIRYTRAAQQVVCAPFVGVDYDDRQSADRITVREFNAWRFVVINKHVIDWPAEPEKPVCPGRLAVIVPAFGSRAVMGRCLEALLAANTDSRYDIVLVSNGSSQEMLDLLAFVALANPCVQHIQHRGALTLALAFNVGACHALGEYLVLLEPHVEVLPGWDAPLVAGLLEPTVGAVQPKVLGADGLVSSAGVVFSGQSPMGYPAYAGFSASAACVNRPRHCQALDGGVLAVRRRDFFRLGGLYPLYLNAYESQDLCFRLQQHGFSCLYEPASSVVHHGGGGGVADGHIAQNRQVFFQRWHERVQPDDLGLYQQDGFVVAGWLGDGIEPLQVAAFKPLLARPPALATTRKAKPIHFALKVPCPNERETQEWGDYHFARSLGAAFRRLGHRFRIDLRDQWDARSRVAADEVNVLLRGRGELPLRDDQLNLMWLISHPDRTALDELRRYDHVFVASAGYAAYLQGALGQQGAGRVSCLLQCTDPALFYPGPRQGDCAHDILFVGNSRNQYREVIRLALATGVEPAVYGTRWQPFIPASLVKGENIPNRVLGEYYRSAGVVLNDHWPDMRDKGFVSNRIFDVLASGVPVVSDRVAGLPEDLQAGVSLFDGGEPGSFEKALAFARRSDASVRQQRFLLALHVHERHSFDVRAAEIVAMVGKLC